MSSGFCVMKNIPTPFERISLTTCSILSIIILFALSNNKCASSKKNTSFGVSGFPTSGSDSKSSDNSHNKNIEYKFLSLISLAAEIIFTNPRPSESVFIKSLISKLGSPKNLSAPISSMYNNFLIIALIL